MCRIGFWFVVVVCVSGSVSACAYESESWSESEEATLRVAAVTAQFEAATGLRLHRVAGPSAVSDEVELRPPGMATDFGGAVLDDTAAPNVESRYGSFVLTVARDGARSIESRELSNEVQVAGVSIWWFHDGMKWRAVSKFGDVLLVWISRRKVVDSRWHRLAADLRTGRVGR